MSQPFHSLTDYLALLAQGVSAWNEWRSQIYNAWFFRNEACDRSLWILDLRGANLQGAQLARINFRDCNL